VSRPILFDNIADVSDLFNFQVDNAAVSAELSFQLDKLNVSIAFNLVLRRLFNAAK
jgi:hypothetical protein